MPSFRWPEALPSVLLFEPIVTQARPLVGAPDASRSRVVCDRIDGTPGGLLAVLRSDRRTRAGAVLGVGRRASPSAPPELLGLALRVTRREPQPGWINGLLGDDRLALLRGPEALRPSTPAAVDG